MFIIGTGSTLASGPPRYLKSGSSSWLAAACAVASETARIAFAPSLALLGVPSSAIIALSRRIWSRASIPVTSLAMISFTFATALVTPRPRKRSFTPSRSSHASCSPVLAPFGTMALPIPPSARVTTASTVGLPRESITWRPWTRTIFVMDIIDVPLYQQTWILRSCDTLRKIGLSWVWLENFQWHPQPFRRCGTFTERAHLNHRLLHERFVHSRDAKANGRIGEKCRLHRFAHGAALLRDIENMPDFQSNVRQPTEVRVTVKRHLLDALLRTNQTDDLICKGVVEQSARMPRE